MFSSILWMKPRYAYVGISYCKSKLRKKYGTVPTLRWVNEKPLQSPYRDDNQGKLQNLWPVTSIIDILFYRWQEKVASHRKCPWETISIVLVFSVIHLSVTWGNNELCGTAQFWYCGVPTLGYWILHYYSVLGRAERLQGKAPTIGRDLVRLVTLL